MAVGGRVGVVVATRNRRDSLLRTLRRLEALPARPRIVVVDNGSEDDTVRAVRHLHPDVHVVALDANAWAGARTIGVRSLATRYIAFADDDSWWDRHALGRVAGLFDAHPRLGLLAARVLVGPQAWLDPVCAAMRCSPLPRESDLPGPSVLGCLACGTAVRRAAFLDAGGFDARYGVGGEEEPLALALAAAGWGLAYVDDVIAHHHPSAHGARPGRRAREARNRAWTLWLRRPARRAVGGTVRALTSADRDVRRGAAQALCGLPWVLRERQVLPPQVEASLRLLESPR